MERASSPKKDAVEVLVDEIISQIDKKRGEMNRLEFANLLIRNRLEKYYKKYNYINELDEEELYRFIKEVIEMLGHCLEFLCELELSKTNAKPLYQYVQNFQAFYN